MTHPPLDTEPRRRRPWSRRTSTGADVTVAIVLFLLEAAVFLSGLFGYGMEAWAAQGDQERIAAADLAGRQWMAGFLVALLLSAVLAMVSRAPWTAASQLLAAAAVAALLVLAQHAYARSHPTPAPRPGPEYVPCHSGSGRCT
ncbi:hypothetical protein PL81_27730 [Streptomyces sp. RSD-27]|nr:hypothetical protein PL81_27730 [Streptomyces sp. RSD-27]